ncbi:bZIP transcription factor 16 isoform X2 [Raphanus sativus]|uniref:BZIP transcription factor 16 isoform X2 n=1 Tax=Raphanus sativus TaxID=3726 RepID=A0A9W3DCQ7_RAPSA|nr:bZIP transcription factor 16 isoform X2 [Raphanus sativus]
MEKSSTEKEPKQPSSSAAPPSSQEPTSAVSAGMATPDWSGFQAYSPMPPHGFVASSPQPHPYMWGPQHMMMPPYGTPPHPYVKMYLPGGMYPHPSMPPGSYPYSPYAMPSPKNGMTKASGHSSGGGTEGDSKRSAVKEKLPIRRSERILNMKTGKNNGTGENSETSANEAYSKSGESASDGLSEGSDANYQNDSGSEQDSKDESGGSANGPRNGSAGSSTPLPPVSQNVPVMPKTAAGAPTSAPIPGMNRKVYQDEREVKRQRRKQTNREAAERSRLRKQAEFDELAKHTEVLNAENASLRAEMNRLKRQREELTSENNSLKLQLLSFPPLEGINIKIEKDDQEPDTYQTDFTETKFVM